MGPGPRNKPSSTQMNRSHWVKLYVDLDQPMTLCRWCRDQTDAPYERGRLVVTALGAGQFTFEVVQRAARGTPQAPTFAHVGKIHPVGNDRDSSVFGGVRFAHVGKTAACDVVRGPDRTTVNSQSDAP